MIEVPRAALTADQIAGEADFFSFGTNDLTQMTWGFSRDDVEASLLPGVPHPGDLGGLALRVTGHRRRRLADHHRGDQGTTSATRPHPRRLRRARRRPGLDPLLRGRRARLRLVLTVPHPRGQAGGRTRRARWCKAARLSDHPSTIFFALPKDSSEPHEIGSCEVPSSSRTRRTSAALNETGPTGTLAPRRDDELLCWRRWAQGNLRRHEYGPMHDQGGGDSARRPQPHGPSRRPIPSPDQTRRSPLGCRHSGSRDPGQRPGCSRAAQCR